MCVCVRGGGEWLDQGVGRSFKNDPWGVGITFIFA